MSRRMKQSPVEWLLEPKDPSIRFHTLMDLLGRRTGDKDVVATKERIRNYGPVRKIMGRKPVGAIGRLRRLVIVRSGRLLLGP